MCVNEMRYDHDHNGISIPIFPKVLHIKHVHHYLWESAYGYICQMPEGVLTFDYMYMYMPSGIHK